MTSATCRCDVCSRARPTTLTADARIALAILLLRNEVPASQAVIRSVGLLESTLPAPGTEGHKTAYMAAHAAR